MHFLGLIPVLFALNGAIQVAAAPTQATKVIPLPVFGAFTLGMVGPTNLPSVVTPNAGIPGGARLPIAKRAIHGNPRLQPRQYHNADFSASPNASVPVPPASSAKPAAEAALQRRDRPSIHKGSEYRAAHGHATGAASGSLPLSGAALPASGGSSSAASAAGGVVATIKSVGSIPKQDASPAYYSLPLGEIPDTPVTQPDAIPADEQAVAPVPAPAPAATPEDDATPVDPNAYPATSDYSDTPGYQAGGSDFVADDSSAQTDTSTAAPVERRHDLILDTDPLIPPSGGAPRDPRMGFINIDSNRKPEPIDDPAPKLPQGAETPVPGDVSDGSLDPQYPDVAYDSYSDAPQDANTVQDPPASAPPPTS